MTTSMNPTRSASYYRCVECYSELHDDGGQAIECAVCGNSYPSIAEIKLMVSNPIDLMFSNAERPGVLRQEAENRWKELLSVLEKSGADSSGEALSKLESGHKNQLANLDLIEEALVPVKEFLAGQPQGKSFLGGFLGAGWPASDMFRYFYRDWHDTGEQKFLTRMFSGAIKEHCAADPNAMAVLGCGACGLLYSLSEFFPASFGVELSISTLLFAKKVLDGEAITTRFNLPNDEVPIEQLAIGLRGPARTGNGIQLVAADVNRLPFKSSSLSCVVTQYLFDIMGNQPAFAAEVRRVLEPGGVWINFGVPQYVRLQDQITNMNLPAFFAQTGFDLLDLAEHQYVHLDMTEVSHWSYSYKQPAIFFVVKKNATQHPESPDGFAEYFAKQGNSVLNKVPRLSAGIAIQHETVFSRKGIKEQMLVEIQQARRLGAIGMAKEAALFADWFLRQMDGSRSVGEITTALRATFGEVLKEGDVLKLFRQLKGDAIISLE